MAVCLEENQYIPTLSYSDFASLFRSGKLTWASIIYFVTEKYKRLAGGEEEGLKAISEKFNIILAKNLSSVEEPKNVLLFPGRWPGFTLGTADALAQDILAHTLNKSHIFISRVAHPLTNKDNAAELNPHLTWGPSGLLYTERYFYDAEVGMGEEIFGREIRFGLTHNFRKFIFVKVKSHSDPP